MAHHSGPPPMMYWCPYSNQYQYAYAEPPPPVLLAPPGTQPHGDASETPAPLQPYQRKRKLPPSAAQEPKTVLPLLEEPSPRRPDVTGNGRADADRTMTTTTTPAVGTAGEGEVRKKKQRVQKTKLFGRTHWVVKEDEEEKGRETAAQHQSAVLASIKQTLAAGGKASKAQKKAMARDPAVLAKLPTPKFVDARIGRGVKPDDAKRAEQLHSRKLIGTQYHLATRGGGSAALRASNHRPNSRG